MDELSQIVKVAAVRLPPDQLAPHLDELLTGLLVWAHDSKNRFKAKVRGVVERLVRRCGADAVTEHVPSEHAPLVAHIRRQQAREEKRKRAGSQAGDTLAAPSVGGGGARTARGARSTWNESELFSHGGDARTVRSAARAAAKQPLNVRLGGGRRGTGRSGKDEPLDLMDEGTMRSVFGRGSAGSAGRLRTIFDDSEDDEEDA